MKVIMEVYDCLWQFVHNYCKDNKIDLHEGNFTLSYDTNIPRQVKL